MVISTAMRMILGLHAPRAGQVSVNGASYARLQARPRTKSSTPRRPVLSTARTAANQLRWLAQSNTVRLGLSTLEVSPQAVHQRHQALTSLVTRYVR